MSSTKRADRRGKIITLRDGKPAGRAATPARTVRKTSRKRQPARTATNAPPRKAHRPVISTPRNALPSWHDLATGEKERHRLRARHATFLETISTTRFGILIIAIAAAFTLYVGHVHATQDLLAEVQTIRKENLRLHLQYNRLKGDFDRATGPSVIYREAGALGLEEGIAYGPTIRVTAP